MMTVSYIIPFFNAAESLKRCVASLMAQSYEALEYIFVDDASTDGSHDVLQAALQDYPERKDQVKILRHPHNLGSSTSRNDGLDQATGSFVMFADADDYVDQDYVRTMVREATDEDCDIVYCDFYETYSDHENLMSQNQGTDASACICAMMSGSMHGATWNKIYRRDFLLRARQRFLDGADLYEDVGWNVRLFALRPRLGYLPKAFYHYVRDNANSIIGTLCAQGQSRRRCLQRIRNIELACSFLQAHHLLEGNIRRAANEWKLDTKNGLVEDNDYSLKKWMVCFPEADAALWYTKRMTFNFKLLMLWVHFRCLPLYHLQKSLTSKLNR